jgi:hypothetical protein
MMFISGGITFFIYSSRKQVAYFVWTVAAAFCGAYFLFGGLVIHFSPSLLPGVPVLGLVMAALGVITVKKILSVARAPPTKVTEAALPSISVQPGESYLLEGEKPTRAFELLKQLSTAQDTPCMCITSTAPAHAKRKYGLEKVKVIWLSKQEVKDSISPGDLDILRDAIMGFIKRHKGGAVLLDGIEQLIATNGFELTLKFLYDVSEGIALRQAMLIISLNPRAIEDKQLATLEQRMVVEK